MTREMTNAEWSSWASSTIVGWYTLEQWEILMKIDEINERLWKQPVVTSGCHL